MLSTVLTPPGLVQFVHNGANAYEMERSQVNAYVHANVVRDFVLAVHPDFPGIADQADFPINVNLNANCNAFYVPGSPSINFFTSGNGCPNTAYDTVVYHEFGHHLVNMGGSGQGAYGEGMSDVIAVLVTDQPVVGAGWRGDCEQWLRTADNDCQYSPLDCTSNCGSEIHACGRLLSGSIWTLRNALFDVDPTNAHALVTALALNSILLHEGSSIGPDIAIDFLVLDDDNGNLLDGTPHYPQIAAAFAAHGLDLPVIDPIGFSFPNGLPERIAPAGGSTVRVEVGGLLGAPQPGTGVFHVSVEGPLGPFVEVPMFEIEPNVYDAVFPAADCGSEVSYFFSAESVGGITVTHPASVPAGSFTAVAATGVQLAFAEDFEAASGWTIENDAGLSGGAWQIGVPAGDGDRGDPLIDGDGSGQCALTGNEAGNSDVDGGATMLISPPLDLPNGPAFLSYDRWYSNGAGNNPGQDVFLVQVSADGGSTWMDLEVVGPAGVDTGGGWVHRDSRVDGLLAAGQPLRIRFVASDTNPPSIVEAAVDGVTVRVFSCQACAGDVTGDGEVDVADLLAVLLAWGEVDSPADVDGSGLVDVLDLVTLLQSWGACT